LKILLSATDYYISISSNLNNNRTELKTGRFSTLGRERNESD